MNNELLWLIPTPHMETPTNFFTVDAVLAAVLSYVIFALRRRSCGATPPLPPGPSGLPIVGSLPFLDPKLHSYFAKLATTYGPIYSLRLGSKLGIIVSSPSLAREVLRDHDPTFANRDVPAAARISVYGGQDIVWTPNGPTWRMLRRVCVREMLSPASLDAVYALRRREMRATVSHIKSVDGRPIDVGAQMFLTALNVITGMLWGGAVQGGAEERGAVGGEFREIVAEITHLLGAPNVSDFFPALAKLDLQGICRKMAPLLGRFDRMFEAIIQKRTVGNGASTEDFLQFMLKMEADQVGVDPKTPFTMLHVRGLLMDMVVGGTEATANTMEWALAEMMQKPEIMRRAQEELDQVVGKDGDVVEESHIPKLHYLSMVIKEVLRLHPALPLLVPHCPSAPCTVGGYLVPQGSRVFVNVWAIHRDPSVWEDPLEFRPERFMEGNWNYSGNDYSYFPFGSGRRICAGITMAERMVTYALASMLHSFDWKLPDEAKLDLTEKSGIVLKMAKPLVAIPTPRLNEPELYS